MKASRIAASVATLSVILAASGPVVARADETGPNFTFGASTSFVYDVNQPDHQVTHENQKTYADGESEESFNVDLVQLGVSGSRSIVSYGAKIDFGDWSAAIQDNIDGDAALQEMYLAIDTGPVLLSAGRMPTPIGYEVLEPWADPNISRSRAWFFQPVSHDGAAIAGNYGGVSMMAAVVNGFQTGDHDLNNPDDEYGVIASFGMPFDNIDSRLSAIYSDEKDSIRYWEVNALVSGKWNHWRYGLEGTYLGGDGHGNGSGQPVPQDVDVYDVTGYSGVTIGKWSGDVRLSYTDQKGTNGNYFNQNHDEIVSFTLTGGYEIVDGVIFRTEYRIDHSSEPIFDDHNSELTAAGPVGQTDTINVINVQLLWTPATGLH